MKKATVIYIICIILILLGAIAIPCSTIHYLNYDLEEDPTADPKIEKNSFTVSYNFIAGDYFKLEVTPAADWIEGLDYIPKYGKFKSVLVNITSPSGLESEIELIFKPRGAILYLYDVNPTTINGLVMDEEELPFTPTGVEGQVLENGTYTAEVTLVYLSNTPPAAMAFYKMKLVSTTEYPYIYLLYIGGFFIFLGSVGIVKVRRKEKRKVLYRKRRVFKKK